jgi:hypothetical protein
MRHDASTEWAVGPRCNRRVASAGSWLAWDISRRAWDDGASSDCVTSADYFNDATFALANAAAAVALASSFVLLRGALRWIALAAAIGAVAFGIGNSVEHCIAEPFFLLFVAGGLTYVLAGCGLAAGLLVTGQLGRWPGLLLGVAALGLMVLDSERGGAAVTGVAASLRWLVGSADLRRNRGPTITTHAVGPIGASHIVYYRGSRADHDHTGLHY